MKKEAKNRAETERNSLDIFERSDTNKKYLSLEDLASIKRGSADEICQKDVEEQKENTAVLGAVLNFQDYLNSLCSDKKMLEEVSLKLSEYSFEELTEFLKTIIFEKQRKVLRLRQLVRKLNKNEEVLLNEMQESLIDLSNDIVRNISRFFDDKKTLTILLKHDFALIKEAVFNVLNISNRYEDEIYEVLMMIENLLFNLDENFENVLKKAKDLFSFLFIFYKDSLSAHLSDFEIFKRKSPQEYASCARNIVDKTNKYSKNEELVQENIEIIEEFEQLDSFLNNNPLIKVEILIAFRNLFLLAKTRSGAEELAHIDELLFLFEPAPKNASVFEIATIPSTTFSDNEIRALRLYFGAIMSGEENPSEMFRVKEFGLLASVIDEIELKEPWLYTLSGKLIYNIKKLKDERIGDFLFNKVMQLEKGLLVRDKVTGHTFDQIENNVYVSGNKWVERQGFYNFDANYTPSLIPHSIKDRFDRIVEEHGRDEGCLVKYNELKDYAVLFEESPEDSIEEIIIDLENSLFEKLTEKETIDDVFSQLEREIAMVSEEKIDRKFQILSLFAKIGDLIEEKHEEVKLEQLKKIFDLIDNCSQLVEVFNHTEILSLKYFVIHKYLKAGFSLDDSSKNMLIVGDWQYDLFDQYLNLFVRKEEVLASILPFIDKIERSLHSQMDTLGSRLVIETIKQVQLSEWGLSDRPLFVDKKVHKRGLLIQLLKASEKRKKLIEESELAELDFDYELEAIQKKHHRNLLIAKIALPASIVFLISSLVYSTLFREEENDLVSPLVSVEALQDDVKTTNYNDEKPDTDNALIEKYNNGELLYLSLNSDDDLAFEVLSSFWSGIESKEEGKEFFESLSIDAKKEMNQILEELTEIYLGKNLSIEEKRKEILKFI